MRARKQMEQRLQKLAANGGGGQEQFKRLMRVLVTRVDGKGNKTTEQLANRVFTTMIGAGGNIGVNAALGTKETSVAEEVHKTVMEHGPQPEDEDSIRRRGGGRTWLF